MRPVRLLCYKFFCGPDGAQRSIAFLSLFLILLTNKQVATNYWFTICEKRTKYCAHHLWCYLPLFITSPLAFLLTMEWHLPKMDHSWLPLQAIPFVRVKLTLRSLRTRKGKKERGGVYLSLLSPSLHVLISSPFSHPFSKTGQCCLWRRVSPMRLNQN